MIELSDTQFPQNIVVAVADRAPGYIDEDVRAFKRPLRNSDPNQSFGVFGNLWQPDESSFEIRGGAHPGPMEPTVNIYTVGIQAFVKDADEQRGLAIHSIFAQRVRAMLYRDEQLRVTLASMVSNTGNAVERVLRWSTPSQRLISNDINKTWLYLSTLELRVETQSR